MSSASQTPFTVTLSQHHRGGPSNNGRIHPGHTLPLASQMGRAGGHPGSQELVADQEDNPADMTLSQISNCQHCGLPARKA